MRLDILVRNAIDLDVLMCTITHCIETYISLHFTRYLATRIHYTGCPTNDLHITTGLHATRILNQK